jgi:hypothetical protein
VTNWQLHQQRAFHNDMPVDVHTFTEELPLAVEAVFGAGGLRVRAAFVRRYGSAAEPLVLGLDERSWERPFFAARSPEVIMPRRAVSELAATGAEVVLSSAVPASARRAVEEVAHLSLHDLTPASPLFLGVNIPWHWFGYDIGGGAFDGKWFGAFFASIEGKSNVVRFFLHADGRATPQFDASGFVVGLTREDKVCVACVSRHAVCARGRTRACVFDCVHVSCTGRPHHV